MDLTAFLTDLLVKPQSEANIILLKIVRLLFVILLSIVLWIGLGGTIVIPTEINIHLIFDIFLTGKVIMPLLMLIIVSLILKFMENFILPLLISIISFVLKRLGALFFYFRYFTLRNKLVKKAVAIMNDIGFIRLGGNAIKKGNFFRIFKTYSEILSPSVMAKLSKEHLNLLSFIIQLLLIWIFLIAKADFCPDTFFKLIKYILYFLLFYVPINLAYLYAIYSLKVPFEELITILEKRESLNKLFNDNNPTN